MAKTAQSGEPDRDLYSGLIRLHILQNAAEEPIFGLGMAEELARQGYRISPGTLYPLLDGLREERLSAILGGEGGPFSAPGVSRDTSGQTRSGGGEGQNTRAFRGADSYGLIPSRGERETLFHASSNSRAEWVVLVTIYIRVANPLAHR
jgi:hypothetical protein